MARQWMRRSATVVGLVAAAGLAVPGWAWGQALEIGGTFGFCDPLGALVERGSRTVPTSFFQKRQQVAPALGADVTFWTSKRFGVTATFALSPSAVADTDSTGVHDRTGALLLTSVRVLYAVTPTPITAPARGHLPNWSFYAGAGVGLVGRSGTVWTMAYKTGLTVPALVLNFGMRAPVSSRGLVRLEVVDYLSKAHFDEGLPTETVSRSHNDFVVNLGLAFQIKRR